MYRYRVQVQGTGYRVQGTGYRVQGTGYRVRGTGYGHRVQEVEGRGYRISRRIRICNNILISIII